MTKKTHNQERALIDFETHKFLQRVAKLNKELHLLQVTDVSVKINEPSPVRAKMWWQKIFSK